MAIIWALLLVAPFFIPLHFYPIPTFPEELVAALLLVALSVCAILRSRSRVHINQLIFWWLGIGAIWFLSWQFNQKQVVSGAFFYQLFWVLGLFALVAGESLKVEFGTQKLIYFTARVLAFSGFLYASVGLFGYYGGLKFLLPWMSNDYPRLYGVLAHPNLSGLYLSLSLAAFAYFINIGSHRILQFRTLVFVFVVCLAGILTGSRAFFVILFAQFFVTGLWFFSTRGGSLGNKLFGSQCIKYVLSVIILSVAMFTAFPPVDQMISKKLTDSGFLSRSTFSEMIAERYSRSDQPRLGEWRKILQGTEVIEDPLVGVGPGAYSEFSVAADAVVENPFRNGKTWRNAHNIFLMSFVEWGVIGLIFIVVFFGFLAFKFFKAERSAENYFVWLALSAILTHNLVEFSLWHLQFLIIFLVLLSTQVRTLSFRLTSPSLRWLIVVPIVLLTLWITSTSSRDFMKMVYLFSKPEVGQEDVRTLDLVAQNSLWRPYARMVMYYRLNPYSTGIENQLKEATVIAEWSPGNLVLMRQASLTAALGEEELACKRIARATELYPAIKATLDEELVYLESNGAPVNLDKMRNCFSQNSVQR